MVKLIYNHTWPDGGRGVNPPMDQKSRPHSMDDFGPSHRVKKKDPEVFLAEGRKKSIFGKNGLKTPYLSIFGQKHSFSIVFSVFTPFVHQKGALFCFEMVTLYSS